MTTQSNPDRMTIACGELAESARSDSGFTIAQTPCSPRSPVQNLRPARGDSGFTIAEAVISAALMAMVFCAMLYAFLSARHGTLAATNNMMAMSEAREEMETIIAQTYTNIVSFTTTNITSGPLAGLSATKACAVTTNIANCKQVTLQIQWRNQASGTNSTISLTTLVSDN